MINARGTKSSPIRNAVVVMENSAGYRKWGGNQGYQDSPGEDYAFDSTVHLASEIQIGTLLVISRDRVIEELGLVHSIRAIRGVKETLHCPKCERQSLEKRASGDFYCTRCKESFTLAEVVVHAKPVTKYVATYGGSNVSVSKRPDSSSILPFMENRDVQSAIRCVKTIALGDLADFLEIDLESLHFPDDGQD